MEKLQRFNPLSTGHAPAINSPKDVVELRFNPLSTGHARVLSVWQKIQYYVSIPYLRVTHEQGSKDWSGVQPRFNPLSTGHALNMLPSLHQMYPVSIPYLRVTHKGLFIVVIVAKQVSIPYLRVTHLSSYRKLNSFPWFQSPIYGSRTKGISNLLCHFFMFQSPIYGSRTQNYLHFTKAE